LAFIERTAKSTFSADGTIMLDLDQRSFGNAARIAAAINAKMGQVAEARGPGQVAVRAPPGASAQVGFVADMLETEVTTEMPVAEVVIDAQSGTVVLGQDVRIGPAAVAYGSLAVTVNETPEVSQPGPFSNGRTRVLPRTQVKAQEKTAKVVELTNAPRVSDIVRNLNAIGATSSDLIAILQALKQSGSLHARIKVI
jgi:flagellar P-ring protein precursor FlgI